MEVIRNVARMQHLAHRLRGERTRIALVPTRGHLHDGHLALVRRALRLADVAIVSILPLAKEPTREEGEKRLSATLTNDVELLISTGVNYVFAPPLGEFLPSTAVTEVIVRGLTERLFSPLWPGYYVRASTALTALLQVTAPEILCLGQKDPQLVALAKRLIGDLHIPCQLVTLPIVRERDGVAACRWLAAMSDQERQAATLIYKALERAQVMFGAGERDAANLMESVREQLEPASSIQIDYLGVVDRETLEPLATIGDAPALIAIAVTIGRARLIDNIILE